MKHKKRTFRNLKAKLISLLVISAFSFSTLSAQSLYVKESGDTQTSYALSEIQNLSFSAGNISVKKADNNSDVYALSDIQYLNFVDLFTGFFVEDLDFNNSNLLVYPNPVTDFLNINLKGFQEAGTINIYGIDGKVLHKEETNGDAFLSINLSYLSKGVYFCSYSSSKEIKTVKIIKN